ncbi:hypothetical protein BC834DRAFT_871498 [Gloeopeniophorella convolvens]|nr:hypothetical protein BC834DRAFT_871498 [Gloeopeniophorella convolvens]
MKGVPFDILRAAASRGPVIFTNHCSQAGQCGVITISRDVPPSFFTLARGFFERGPELVDGLLDPRRKYGLDPNQYDRALRSVLGELYTHIGHPVITELRELGVPEGSHVWWCPTSIFCSLPLHAMHMGSIPSTDKVKRYFSDVYMPLLIHPDALRSHRVL